MTNLCRVFKLNNSINFQPPVSHGKRFRKLGDRRRQVLRGEDSPGPGAFHRSTSERAGRLSSAPFLPPLQACIAQMLIQSGVVMTKVQDNGAGAIEVRKVQGTFSFYCLP